VYLKAIESFSIQLGKRAHVYLAVGYFLKSLEPKAGRRPIDPAGHF